jgi:hypothetical protein
VSEIPIARAVYVSAVIGIAVFKSTDVAETGCGMAVNDTCCGAAVAETCDAVVVISALSAPAKQNVRIKKIVFFILLLLM